jgi:hypothetical protein
MVLRSRVTGGEQGAVRLPLLRRVRRVPGRISIGFPVTREKTARRSRDIGGARAAEVGVVRRGVAAVAGEVVFR